MRLDKVKMPLVIAEISGNHGGSLDKAKALIEECSKSGADMVKLQTFKPETITVNGKDNRFMIKKGLWAGSRLHDLYKRAMTPWEWHGPLAQHAQDFGIPLFSSPFDETAVDFLESRINPPLYKIASFELNHFPLLRRIGETQKPVIASIGVSEQDIISKALQCLYDTGCPRVTLLHCVSEYPAEPDDFFLREMPLIREKYGTDFGISDHSLGHLVAVAATALGATVIEKHFTLDRNLDSVDGAFSMLPNEFAEMVNAVHLTKRSIGSHVGKKIISPDSAFYKRSILVSENINKGEEFTELNIRIARPGDGMCPSMWSEILGARSSRDLVIGHPLSTEDIA